MSDLGAMVAAMNAVYAALEMPGAERKEASMAECKSCGKEITWVRTESGKMLPCDIDAEILLEKDGERLVVLKPHWATCKDSNFWRRKGKK